MLLTRRPLPRWHGHLCDPQVLHGILSFSCFLSPCIASITCPLPLTYWPLPPSPRTKADVHACILARACAGELMSSSSFFIDSFICNGVFRSLIPGAGHSRDALVFMGLALSGCLRRGGPRSPPWTPSISQSVMTCKMMLCMFG